MNISVHAPETGLNPFAPCPKCEQPLMIAYDTRLWCENCCCTWPAHAVYEDIQSKLQILRDKIENKRQAKIKAYMTLRARKLPIPEDLRTEVEGWDK